MYNNFVRQLVYSNFELTSLTFFIYFCYNIIGIYEKVSDIMAMTKQNFINDCIIFNTLNDLVPQDHLVRKLDNCIDFTFIEDLVKNLLNLQ